MSHSHAKEPQSPATHHVGTATSPLSPTFFEWTHGEKDFINGLPNELLLFIWAQLDTLFDLFIFGQVCRRWRLLTYDDRLWSKIFAHSFGTKAQKKLEREMVLRPPVIANALGQMWRDAFFKRMQQTVLRCQITFAIRYNTVPGQIVAVVGNVDALGAWDVRKAHRMEYVHSPNENEPNWKLTLSIPIGLLRKSIRLEYKYVLVNDDMVPLRWETTSRRKEIFRGESVYYFRNYWNRVGYEFCSGYRHQYWENQRWSIDLNTCRKVITT